MITPTLSIAQYYNFRSFCAFNYEGTKDFVTSYKADNPKISVILHDQGILKKYLG